MLRAVLLALPCCVATAVAALGDVPQLRSTSLNATLKDVIAYTNAAVSKPELELYLHEDRDAVPDSEKIPVYHVPAKRSTIVAEVPWNCRCIVVRGSLFDQNMAKFSEDGALSADDPKQMLTFVILHELGHIAEEHYGSFLPGTTDARPNKDAALSKTQEFEADAFVASVLKKAFEPGTTGDYETNDETGATVSRSVFLATSDVFLFLNGLSWDVFGQATLTCFGCRTMGDPRIFWDHSTSHPNFEYRLLKLLQAMSPTDEGAELLQMFEVAREAGWSGVLYRAE